MELIALVIPCYNEEDVFSDSCKKLKKLLEEMVNSHLIDDKSFILFVDDGSVDKTWCKINEACQNNKNIRGLKLSTNVGHQSALLAGLEMVHNKADAVISIDADLQDDIQAIPQMIKAYQKGYDIVYGVRKSRDSDHFLKRITADIFYKIMSFMGVKQIPHHADFRLMSKRALNAFLKYSERNSYLRGLVPLIGFPSTSVYYDRVPRLAGESKYPFYKMLLLAIEGVTSMTVFPLRMITFIGFFIFCISIIMILYIIIIKIMGHTIVGWASVMFSLFFLGGLQLLSLGIIGEYIGKIYLETKKRPRFHIEAYIDGDEKVRLQNKDKL